MTWPKITRAISSRMEHKSARCNNSRWAKLVTWLDRQVHESNSWALGWLPRCPASIRSLRPWGLWARKCSNNCSLCSLTRAHYCVTDAIVLKNRPMRVSPTIRARLHALHLYIISDWYPSWLWRKLNILETLLKSNLSIMLYLTDHFHRILLTLLLE